MYTHRWDRKLNNQERNGRERIHMIIIIIIWLALASYLILRRFRTVIIPVNRTRQTVVRSCTNVEETCPRLHVA